MNRKWIWWILVAMLVGCTAATAEEMPAAEQAVEADACLVTPPSYDQPPKDPNADPFGYGPWHISADRALWVELPPNETWRTGGEKVMWIRPAGADLTISGERIDQKGPPLEVEIPCCYPTGFQVTGLTFPEPGCWRISAQAGDHQLEFITRVEAEIKQ